MSRPGRDAVESLDPELGPRLAVEVRLEVREADLLAEIPLVEVRSGQVSVALGGLDIDGDADGVVVHVQLDLADDPLIARSGVAHPGVDLPGDVESPAQRPSSAGRGLVQRERCIDPAEDRRGDRDANVGVRLDVPGVPVDGHHLDVDAAVPIRRGARAVGAGAFASATSPASTAASAVVVGAATVVRSSVRGAAIAPAVGPSIAPAVTSAVGAAAVGHPAVTAATVGGASVTGSPISGSAVGGTAIGGSTVLTSIAGAAVASAIRAPVARPSVAGSAVASPIRASVAGPAVAATLSVAPTVTSAVRPPVGPPVARTAITVRRRRQRTQDPGGTSVRARSMRRHSIALRT